ncbi:hypothetical protein Goe10_c02040 [Bacillus phage vB_BsuM-Goe10]|nr:hypothetical protein Goe10_c00060 [Bacillus phage vB_BsuM-Goe10]QMV48732.1 hypothetical protein Goe10_c02040 [Bacillus phage vB_BsuM-Goe10]
MARYLNVDILVNHKDKKYKANGYLAPSKGDLILALIDGELEAAEVREVADIVGSQLFVKSPDSNDKKGYKFTGQYLVLKPYGSSDPKGDILVHEGAQYVRIDAQAMVGDLVEILEPYNLTFGMNRLPKLVYEVEYVRSDEQVLQLENGKSYSGAYRVLIPRMGVLPPKTHRYTTHKHVFMEDAFKEGYSYLITESGDAMAGIFVGFSQDYKTAFFKNPAYDTLDLDVDVEQLLTGKRDITPLVPKKGV